KRRRRLGDDERSFIAPEYDAVGVDVVRHNTLLAASVDQAHLMAGGIGDVNVPLRVDHQVIAADAFGDDVQRPIRRVAGDFLFGGGRAGNAGVGACHQAIGGRSVFGEQRNLSGRIDLVDLVIADVGEIHVSV